MTTNKIPEFTDHHGGLLVMVVGPDEEPEVYAHRRLSDRAANGSTCEACGYKFSKHDAHRVPMYDSIPLHADTTLSARLVFCQPCMDMTSATNGPDNYWYTGQYQNQAPPTTRKVRL